MSCVKSLYFLLLLVLFSFVQSKQMCDLNDIQCLTNAAKKGFKFVMDGIPGLIEPTEALLLKEVKGEITPALKYTLSNATMTNMKKCNVIELRIKIEDFTFIYHLRCPELFIHFGFEAKGTLGNDINVDGKGQAKLILDDYLFICKGQYGKYISEKDQKLRIFVDSYYTETEVKGKATIASYKMIRGNPEIAERAKAYMNKNGKEMANFLQRPMMEDFMKLFINKTNIYLNTYPLDEVIVNE